jgi:uncharacterized protein YbjT (DUF2867 family)
MTVLITGGSGFVGRAITAELFHRGHSVRWIARTAGPHDGIEVFRGTLLEGDALDRACRGCDAIIHLVGIIAETPAQTFERVHVAGTARVLDAARRAGVRRLLHMSALGTRPNAVSRYHQTKWQAEELVRGSALDWTIFRPSLVYGRGDGFVSLHLRLARLAPVLALMGGGRTVFQPVAVEDVAQAFVAALAVRASLGKVYLLGGPDRVTYRQLAADILSAAGLRRFLLPMPIWAAWPGAWASEILFRTVLRGAAPFSRDQLRMLLEDNIGDITPARAELGFQPRPWREGLAMMTAG